MLRRQGRSQDFSLGRGYKSSAIEAPMRMRRGVDVPLPTGGGVGSSQPPHFFNFYEAVTSIVTAFWELGHSLRKIARK